MHGSTYICNLAAILRLLSSTTLPLYPPILLLDDGIEGKSVAEGSGGGRSRSDRLGADIELAIPPPTPTPPSCLVPSTMEEADDLGTRGVKAAFFMSLRDLVDED